jgi:hypothetical protein
MAIELVNINRLARILVKGHIDYLVSPPAGISGSECMGDSYLL